MEKVKEKKIEMDNKFLGNEKIGKLLRMFAIPCVLALVIQALYNIVDQLFIGNCGSLGELGNTATGIVYPLTVVALAIGALLGDGSAACLSISQGKNQTKDNHKTVGTAIVIGIVVSAILVGVSFGCRDSLLNFFGASEGVFGLAKEYSTWIIAGFPFYIMATIINPVIRSDGSPKYAMLSMIIGAVVNIILDPIFIFVCNMGMTGAALATFIAQVVSFALSIAYLFKSKNFRLKLKSFIPDFGMLFTSFKLGISSFLTQISIVIVATVNNNILLKYLPGDNGAIGMLTIAFKIFGIVISVAIGIACGGQPILGYNYGAKKYDRVKETYKLIMIVTLVVGVIATILFEACPQFLLMMFGYNSISAFGANIFRIYLGFILLTCATKATSIFFQSVGMPVKSTIIAMLRDLIILVPLAIVLPRLGGIDLFLWSAPISDIVTTIVTVIFVVMFLKKINTKCEVKNENIVKENVVIKKSKPGVIVTISREHGAGGREIAEKLAKKLGVPFYDNEVASLVAKESGLDSDYVDNIEEKGSLFYNLYLNNEANQTAIVAQQKVLKEIADNGACVIVGRGANFALKDYKLCKVFVYAPRDYKISRIMNNYGDNEIQAVENMEKSDKKRAQFYKTVTGQDWYDRNNYNLCIDGSLGVDECVDVVFNYIKNIK